LITRFDFKTGEAADGVNVGTTPIGVYV